jgi:hypothetical protein
MADSHSQAPSSAPLAVRNHMLALNMHMAPLNMHVELVAPVTHPVHARVGIDTLQPFYIMF